VALHLRLWGVWGRDELSISDTQLDDDREKPMPDTPTVLLRTHCLEGAQPLIEEPVKQVSIGCLGAVGCQERRYFAKLIATKCGLLLRNEAHPGRICRIGDVPRKPLMSHSRLDIRSPPST